MESGSESSHSSEKAYDVPGCPSAAAANGEGQRRPRLFCEVRMPSFVFDGDDKRQMDGDFSLSPEIDDSAHSNTSAEHKKDGLLFNRSRTHWVAEECLEPFRYICSTPGKNVRSKMIDCFQEWLQIPEEKVPVIKNIVGSLHNASLLIDDIEDDSKLRRGHPVAHMVFGTPSTLNCGNYVYFLALEKVMLELQSTEALQLFTIEMLNLHRGQGKELHWRDTGRCPTMEEYLGMIMDKTGGLFRIGVGLMQCFSQNRKDYRRLINSLSVYFQVRDDLINLASSEYQRNKSFCEDLTEGKFSFPIIHGITHSREGDNRVISVLRQRTENIDLKLSVVNFLRDETKSFLETKKYLKQVYRDIEEEISALGGSSKLMSLMSKLKEEIDECDV